MTTAQSLKLTKQPSISMVVAGQPDTFAGQVRDGVAVYTGPSNIGIFTTNLNRAIGHRENSIGELKSRLGPYSFSVAKDELETFYKRHPSVKMENSPQGTFTADAQRIGSDIAVAPPWNSFYLMEDGFPPQLTNQLPRLVERSVDDDAHQRRPGVRETSIPFEAMWRVFGEAYWHRAYPEKQGRALDFGAWLTSNPLQDYIGFWGLVPAASDLYSKRIETLRGFAADEEITVNETSVRDFRYFVGSVVPTQSAQLVVMDNGNLRAVWKNDDGSHLGLQFLGDHQVQYVVFRRGGPEDKVYRLAGENSFDEMRKSIEVWGLSSLLSA